MDAMLRQALRKHNGLRQQLDNMLLGDNGDQVEAELKKFLTKRPCWIPILDKAKPSKVLIPERKVFNIDLDFPARLPFEGAVLEVHRGAGVVELERKADGVYLDDKKLSIFFSEGQKNGKVIGGYDLRIKLEARGHNLSATILDFFVAHPEFWPDNWKMDLNSDTIYVFFWDDIFRNPSDDDLCVRYGYWDGSEVISGYLWLDNDWHSDGPAASSAS